MEGWSSGYCYNTIRPEIAGDLEDRSTYCHCRTISSEKEAMVEDWSTDYDDNKTSRESEVEREGRSTGYR